MIRESEESRRYIAAANEVLASAYAFCDTPQGKYAAQILTWFRARAGAQERAEAENTRLREALQEPSEAAYRAALEVMWPAPTEINQVTSGRGIRPEALKAALESAYAVDFAAVLASGHPTEEKP